MIPYEVDPSLHPAEPAPPALDDGFSPPAPRAEVAPQDPDGAAPMPVVAVASRQSAS